MEDPTGSVPGGGELACGGSRASVGLNFRLAVRSPSSGLGTNVVGGDEPRERGGVE